jgi:hypothetical protein
MRAKLIVALTFAASAASGQSTADLIQKGIAAYENFQVEAARPIFKQIVSPSYLAPVSAEQKVAALKYLGASYAILEKTDSAVMFFSAALEFDPFTDLDPVKFSASEMGPFTIAKRNVFKVGVRPIYSAVVNPQADSTRYKFQLVSTHRARIKMELISQSAGGLTESLFESEVDGLRDVLWDGLLRANGGRIADSATYILRVTATSALAGQAPGTPTTEAPIYLKIEHSYAPLEDTLPTLSDSMLLLARIPATAPFLDLAKGIMVGVAAYAFPAALLTKDLSWSVHAIVGAAAGIVSGGASFAYRSKKREIPENVAENNRRQQQRVDFNSGVLARNARSIANTKLIITSLNTQR